MTGLFAASKVNSIPASQILSKQLTRKCERQAASEKEERHDVKTICTCTPTFIDTDGCPTHGHVSEEKFERVCDICGQAYIGTRHECQPVAIVPSDPDDPRFDGVVVEREASGGALREELK